MKDMYICFLLFHLQIYVHTLSLSNTFYIRLFRHAKQIHSHRSLLISERICRWLYRYFFVHACIVRMYVLVRQTKAPIAPSPKMNAHTCEQLCLCLSKWLRIYSCSSHACYYALTQRSEAKVYMYASPIRKNLRKTFTYVRNTFYCVLKKFHSQPFKCCL